MRAHYSRLFWKAVLSLSPALLIGVLTLYFLTVPMIDRFAHEAEENASRNVVDTVAELVRRSQRDLELWRDAEVEGRKRDLQHILSLVESWSQDLDRAVADGRMTRSEARARLLERIRAARYGRDDYVWALDAKTLTLSHPDPALNGRSAERLKDVKGVAIGEEMRRRALADGDGYFSYHWRRLRGTGVGEKLTYFRLLQPYGLIIATGVYIDDIEAELDVRRAAALDELRDHLGRIKVGRSGYLFIINGQLDVIAHADAALVGQNMAAADTDGSLVAMASVFLDAAKRPDGVARYEWNHPADPGNYSYRKIAWVRHLPEQDWYIGATGYADELSRSADHLTRRILLAAGLGLLAAVALAYLFLRSLTNPILRLADVARRNVDGDLAAVSDVRRNDEIGELAEAFNQMVMRLRDQIERLEERVEERTQELSHWADQLESIVEARTAELRVSEEKFRGLVEQSVVAICVVQDRQFRYVNPGFAKLHGFDTPDEIIDRVDPLSLLVEESRPVLIENDRRLATGEIEGCEVEFVGLTRDGAPLELVASLRRFEFEGRSALISVSIDLTDRKRAERAREQALAAAEALSRLKSELITNMSHEMRTPVHGIMGLAQIGTGAKDLEKAHSLFGLIAESGERLNGVLTSMLDFSDLETGKLRLESTEVDLLEVIDQVLVSHRPRAEAKGLRLDAMVAPDLPAQYQGDAHRVAQILSILVGNAVKFTDAGRVRLEADRSGDRLVLAVSDTGAGLSTSELQGLFRPFEQLDSSSTRRHGGVGLGLALAQRLASLMGGSLTAESSVGEGSTFTLSLPLETPAAGRRVPGLL